MRTSLKSRVRPHACSCTVALAAAFAGSGASAAPQLFKCVEGGRTVYQQQACAVSQANEPATTAARTTLAAAEPASAVGRKIKRPAPAASSAP